MRSSVATTAAPLAVDAVGCGQLLGIHPETAAKLARAGELPSVMIGRARRFVVADLQEFLRRKAAENAAPSTVSIERTA